MSWRAPEAANRSRSMGTGASAIRLLRWPVAIMAGAAICFWVIPSSVAFVVVVWYLLESASLLAPLSHPHRREVAMAYVLPRAVGTAIAFAFAYLVLLPWDQVLALAYVVLVLLEGAYRWLWRRFNVEALRRARIALDATRHRRRAAAELREDLASHAGRAVRPGRRQGVLALFCALLYLLVFPLTLCAYGARQVALDARFYVSQFERSGLYDEVLRLAGDALTDAARRQGLDGRRLVAPLPDRDVQLAAQLLLPRQWTVSMFEQVVEATLSWIEADDERRVPPISLPIGDIERHLADATSTLLDHYTPLLPLCAPDLPGNAFCRPEGLSVAAHVATYKPENMAIVDDAFALIPAELDLSTAVTMSPRTFQKPLAFLERMRERVRAWDRLLIWGGCGCLLTLACLALLGSTSARTSLAWTGMALAVAAVGTWALSWTVSLLGQTTLLQRIAVKPLLDLPDFLATIVSRALGPFLRTVHVLISPWEILLAGLGLLLALAGLGMPLPRKQHLMGEDVARGIVVLLAVGVMLWARYVVVGRGLYDRAFQAHRRGEVESAAFLYRQVERFYPFTVSDFVVRARRGLRECQRYQKAESSYRSGEYESAVREYEALMVGNPVVALLDPAEEHLLESLYEWAERLRQTGERERALDRYRFIREEYRDRRVHQAIIDLYVEWGETLEAEGDYRAAIATYGRIAYDVPDPRLWALADGRVVDAYCAWSASLRTTGQPDQAAEVCRELGGLPSVTADDCSECRP